MGCFPAQGACGGQVDHVHVQELKPSGRDSGVSWGPAWGEPAGLPTRPPAGETLRSLPSLGEILPSAAHTGLHVKPMLLPRGRERSGRSPRRLGGSCGIRVLFLEVQAVPGVSPVPSLSSKVIASEGGRDHEQAEPCFPDGPPC